MKKVKIFTVIIVAIVIGAGIFEGCQKDTENMELFPIGKKQKLMGDYQQPTQIVDINTVLLIGGTECPVEGNAVVGLYNKQIYECNIMYRMSANGTNATIAPSTTTVPAAPIAPTASVEDMTLHAILKPEFDDIMIPVNPVSENYIMTFSGEITEEDISILWQRIVEICEKSVVVDFRCPYILALSRETGINIFELAESPFFLKFVAQLNDFNSYFVEQIQNNNASMEEFGALMQEFANAPLWKEDYIPQPGESKYLEYKNIYHNFYSLAEKLSQMYFGDNFNDEITFDGVTYHVVAADRINSLKNSCATFNEALINSYPKYLDLSVDMQDKVIRGTLIMGCYDDYLDALAAAGNKWYKAAEACKGAEDCLQIAAEQHADEVKKALGDYCACLREAGIDCK